MFSKSLLRSVDSSKILTSAFREVNLILREINQRSSLTDVILTSADKNCTNGSFKSWRKRGLMVWLQKATSRFGMSFNESHLHNNSQPTTLGTDTIQFL